VLIENHFESHCHKGPVNTAARDKAGAASSKSEN
jgi:hypothetical protein